MGFFSIFKKNNKNEENNVDYFTKRQRKEVLAYQPKFTVYDYRKTAEYEGCDPEYEIYFKTPAWTEDNVREVFDSIVDDFFESIFNDPLYSAKTEKNCDICLELAATFKRYCENYFSCDSHYFEEFRPKKELILPEDPSAYPLSDEFIKENRAELFDYGMKLFKKAEQFGEKSVSGEFRDYICEKYPDFEALFHQKYDEIDDYNISHNIETIHQFFVNTTHQGEPVPTEEESRRRGIERFEWDLFRWLPASAAKFRNDNYENSYDKIKETIMKELKEGNKQTLTEKVTHDLMSSGNEKINNRILDRWNEILEQELPIFFELYDNYIEERKNLTKNFSHFVYDMLGAIPYVGDEFSAVGRQKEAGAYMNEDLYDYHTESTVLVMKRKIYPNIEYVAGKYISYDRFRSAYNVSLTSAKHFANAPFEKGRWKERVMGHYNTTMELAAYNHDTDIMEREPLTHKELVYLIDEIEFSGRKQIIEDRKGLLKLMFFHWTKPRNVFKKSMEEFYTRKFDERKNKPYVSGFIDIPMEDFKIKLALCLNKDFENLNKLLIKQGFDGLIQIRDKNLCDKERMEHVFSTNLKTLKLEQKWKCCFDLKDFANTIDRINNLQHGKGTNFLDLPEDIIDDFLYYFTHLFRTYSTEIIEKYNKELEEYYSRPDITYKDVAYKYRKTVEKANEEALEEFNYQGALLSTKFDIDSFVYNYWAF